MSRFFNAVIAGKWSGKVLQAVICIIFLVMLLAPFIDALILHDMEDGSVYGNTRPRGYLCTLVAVGCLLTLVYISHKRRLFKSSWSRQEKGMPEDVLPRK